MQTFTIGLGRSRWIRVWGSNPLVRRSDRLEAIVVFLAALIVIVSVPFAAAIGTSVHDTRSRLYAEEANDLSQVTASATGRGSAEMRGDNSIFVARATWTADGRQHSGILDWATRVNAGDRQVIWVDARGDAVGPPTPPSQAVSDGVVMGLATWLAVAGAVSLCAYAVRHRLDRSRYAQWDREITASVSGDDGGRRSA